MSNSKKEFTVFKSPKNGKWYWHLKNEFGVIYAHGGNLDCAQTAVEACESVQHNALLAVIKVIT